MGSRTEADCQRRQLRQDSGVTEEALDWAKKAEEDFLTSEAPLPPIGRLREWHEADLVIINQGGGFFRIAKDREEHATRYTVNQQAIMARLLRAGPSVKVYWVNAEEMRENII